jgi:hypothetical protein
MARKTEMPMDSRSLRRNALSGSRYERAAAEAQATPRR